MNDDADLLRRYASENSQEAFRELVDQHLGFVYHTALRHLNGDFHGAEDVAQAVFVALARQAGALADRPFVAGWLHLTTRNIALQMLRTERRRRNREQEAFMNTPTQEPTADWRRLEPVLDEALQSLEPGDREAILMRFFEGRGFAEVGARLQLSADGARSRVDRALDKMQPILARRGVTSTASALGAALAAHAGQLAPTGLAASIANVVLGSAAAASTGTAVAVGALHIMKISSILLAGSLAANALLSVMIVSEAPSVPAQRTTSIAPVPAPARSPSLKSVFDPDPAVFLAHLRAANIPEDIRRALIAAAIDEQFRAREEALRPKRPALAWWQWQDTTLPMQTSLALLDLHREKAKLRQQLLGPDPAIVASDADSPIPPEKREQVKIISEDYSTMLATIPPGPFHSAAETAALAGLKAQRAKDLAEILTPEELDAYADRTWDQLPYLKNQLHGFDATPEEFAVLRDALNERNAPGASEGVYRDPQEEENAKILAAFGESRFDEFYLSKSMGFHALISLLERTGQPREDVLPVYDLWKNAEAGTHAIEANPDFSAEQKIAAVKDLGTTSRAEILRDLGPQAGPAYIEALGDSWLKALDRGDVVTFSTGGLESFRAGTPAAKGIRTSIRLEARK